MVSNYKDILKIIFEIGNPELYSIFYSTLSQNANYSIGASYTVVDSNVVGKLTIPLSAKTIRPKDGFRVINYTNPDFEFYIYTTWLHLSKKGGTVLVDEYYNCFIEKGLEKMYLGNINGICELLN